jgi:ribonuclease BN (tRNA processing enzyme)
VVRLLKMHRKWCGITDHECEFPDGGRRHESAAHCQARQAAEAADAG